MVTRPRHAEAHRDDAEAAEHDADTKPDASRANTRSGPMRQGARSAEELDQMAASSIGAQVILDYNSAASRGARGGAGGTIEENTMARDASLIAVGLDPQAPSGPPTGQPWEPPPPPVTRTSTAQSGTATRMSSLAAGIITEEDLPPPEGGSGNGEAGATAPVNRDVPNVSQSGDTLHCTMGNWDGEPTSYGYQWKIDGNVVGTDSDTYTIAPEDVGKTATCVVTATNNAGSTAAPPSNEITVADSETTTRHRRR